ncbi:ATP-dependent zinc protease [uncultured Thalassolituus sp.]|uniref:ATP-dependent zinc protease family protein n=1 Tax=uncultured Thalassolituus sp. TaxID=285273 RepID=UPI002617796A|nr:ATP-dependent zinc protease [uncultured Thalassolituus sp.]
MLSRVACFAAAMSAASLMAGCSHWPGPDHRQVTMQGISEVVREACTADQSVRDDIDSLSVQLTEQEQQLHSIEAMLATPAPVVKAPPAPVSVVSCKPVAKKSLNFDNKVVVGSNEWIYLNPPGIHLAARVDTGAATSSISATNIVRFERDGKRWVSFDLEIDNQEPVHLEARLKRNVRIRQASYDDTDRRPVVELDVMLGENLRQQTEFTLADRSRMSYPVLLGRSFLRDMALVDVGSEYLHPKVEPDAP